MAPSNPKRPSRPGNPPEDSDTKDDGELPFDERDATPLREDDPKPQRVTTYPALNRGRGRTRSRDTALAGGFATATLGAAASEVFLYAERGPGSGQLLPVAPGALVLGRSSSADLRLPHASISRRHARLVRRGERFFLEDLGSQNGTYVDDERLSSERELTLGQRIHIGPAVLRLRRPGMGETFSEVRDALADGWPSAMHGRAHLWRVALMAGATGFLLAALLFATLARLQPAPAVREPPPATQAR